MTGHLFVNPRSGSGSTEQLLDAARERGVATHVLGAGDDLAALARGVEAGVLGMAGGDGSLAPVAAAALARGVPFVCVPFGTRNHFARDLGLDRDDPVAALDAFSGGVERTIDVARANDRLFLNNVSIGVYARLVHRREHHRRRGDAVARLRALLTVARHRHAAPFSIDGKPVHASVVLVSNNEYELRVLSVGERERLDEGLLHAYAPRGLLRSEWIEQSCDRLTIDSPAGRLQAAVDGEPDVLETPIEFRIEPCALRVLLPRDPGG
jgi:diacylglycerol kinase family enzyme